MSVCQLQRYQSHSLLLIRKLGSDWLVRCKFAEKSIESVEAVLGEAHLRIVDISSRIGGNEGHRCTTASSEVWSI